MDIFLATSDKLNFITIKVCHNKESIQPSGLLCCARVTKQHIPKKAIDKKYFIAIGSKI
jgi:hypothetical protein